MSSNWRADVQGLRAVAVGLVIAGHAGLSGFEGGFVGVDVFFVLSGFLITTLLLRETDRSGTVSISQFYARRARRILPAATATMLVVLTYSAIVLPQTRTDQIAGDAGWAAVFLANVHFAKEAVDYFNTAAPSPFQHYWSLSVEEQFYVVWPLLVLAVALWIPKHHRRRAITALAALVAVVSLAWSLHLTSVDPTTAYFSTPARAFELAAGALLACVAGRLASIKRPYATALGIAGVGTLVYATASFSEATHFPGWHALVPVLGTVALLVAGPATPTGWLLSKQPLRYLGDISFSLYLWHWPILILAPEAIPGGGVRQLLIMLALILAASAASYHWIEMPFQRHKIPHLTKGRRALALWPAAAALALVAGTSSQAYAGYQVDVAKANAEEWFQENPDVLDTDDKPVTGVLKTTVKAAEEGAPLPPEAKFDASDSWAERGGYCYAGYGETKLDGDCVYGDGKADRTVAVVGDSHIGMWLPALDTLAERQHVKLVPFVKLGCAAYGVKQKSSKMTVAECEDFRKWTNEQITELNPDTIVVGARGMLDMEERDGVSTEEQWREGVRHGVSAFEKITPDVRVFADVPSVDDDPGECLSDARNLLEDCVVNAEGTEVDSNEVTQEALDGTEAAYVDIVDLVCSEQCPLVVGDVVTYYDDSHITATWVDRVTPALGKRLGRLDRSA
ncbi:Peptidoglycan/LPS O-acetylase OafA/YrhL, contains acyltransferase and SGNH-hydrolase domains [Nocardioides sp. YR527]|uniref:acyltransferase family protein n=1 Tax=Nocardioides sp. YR527 TaxID=1881028 RepID=UPI000888E16D|nr:acyltransferase family protein [Nocardioides sp. YR527]SDK12018.1 Peptidoglycan/LPS O-acetylase OafA/YrhL, contains acyltransferase and SGNH-hydrolase domains [Nocardioides sp. YR527]